MVKVKGKTTGPAPELANVRVSDSKPSGSSRPSSPEVEENSAPASTARNDRGVGTEAFAGPSAKKEKLQQQLAHVEHQACLLWPQLQPIPKSGLTMILVLQILDLEKLLASSSDPAYSVFKGKRIF